MDRRKFIKLSGAAGIGLALPPGLGILRNRSYAAQTPDIAVASGASPAAITRAAIEAIGGMRRFVSPGDVVVVKPNIGFDRVPEQAANTNPEVVREVVRLCIDAGAKTVKVFDRTVNDPRRCYMQSGISTAAQAAGGKVVYMDSRRFRDVRIGGLALRTWPIYQDIMDADKIINVPIAKHHGLAGLTMGMKNLMGVIGGNRPRFHQSIDECLVDISGKVKPTLTVLDAVRILVANGPQGGSLRDVRKRDTVVAGMDFVAVDSYGATLFGKTGDDLGYVVLGKKTGLGESDLNKLNIRKLHL